MSPCFANMLLERYENTCYVVTHFFRNLISPVNSGDLIEELSEKDNILSEEILVKLLLAIVKWHDDGIIGESISHTFIPRTAISFFNLCRSSKLTCSDKVVSR